MKFLDNVGFSNHPPSHYHGDKVRVLFLAIALFMILGLPFFQEQIPLPLTLSLTSVIFLIFLAGLTNPRQVWVAFLNVVVSLGGLLIFEYFALINVDAISGAFFWVNQILAMMFLIAFYYSTKTLRGFYLRQ